MDFQETLVDSLTFMTQNPGFSFRERSVDSVKRILFLD